ncbi:MAG: DUF2312 domain-containing protein [Proteobacteria bacterium]|nr:DUF2312 domain-containing protein [Pseudomonadota bacterium]
MIFEDIYRENFKAEDDENLPPDAKAKQELVRLVEAVESLEDAKKEVSSRIRLTYDHAKARGFDVTAMREIVRLRKADADAKRWIRMLNGPRWAPERLS